MTAEVEGVGSGGRAKSVLRSSPMSWESCEWVREAKRICGGGGQEGGGVGRGEATQANDEIRVRSSNRRQV